MSEILLAILPQPTAARVPQADRGLSTTGDRSFGQSLQEAQRRERPELADEVGQRRGGDAVSQSRGSADTDADQDRTAADTASEEPAVPDAASTDELEVEEAADAEQDEASVPVPIVAEQPVTAAASPGAPDGEADQQPVVKHHAAAHVRSATAESKDPVVPVAVIGERKGQASADERPRQMEAATQTSAVGETRPAGQAQAGSNDAEADADLPKQNQSQAQLSSKAADAPGRSVTQSATPPSLQLSSEPSSQVRAAPTGMQTAVATPVAQEPDTEAVNAARVARGLQSALAQQGGSVTLRLTPPELGTVRIQLQVQGGQISANFQSGSETARAMLTQQLAQLRSTLEGQGFHVERLTVQPTPTGPGAHLQQQAGQQGQQGQGSPQSHSQQSATDGRSRGAFDQTPQHNQDGRQPRQQSARTFTDWFEPQQPANAA